MACSGSAAAAGCASLTPPWPAWPRGPGTGRGARRPLVVAVDLPSGIDADTGVVDGPAVRADVTVTFGTWKPGLLIDPGAGHAGVVELVDIGLGPYLPAPAVAGFQAADVAALLRQPPGDSDKYRRGVLGIVAGSDRFTGAAALAVGGALRGGAGMVRLVSAGPAVAVVRQHWPEALTLATGDGSQAGHEIETAGRVQAWVAGPGMGTDEAARDRLAAVLGTELPVLVDADGLTLIAAERGLLARAAPTLLTPHAGELARLLGADPARGGGTPPGACPRGRGRAWRDGPAQGLDHGDRPGRGRRGAGQLHRDVVARHRGHGRRALRARGLPAGPGTHGHRGRRGRRVPARDRGPPGRRWRGFGGYGWDGHGPGGRRLWPVPILPAPIRRARRPGARSRPAM